MRTFGALLVLVSFIAFGAMAYMLPHLTGQVLDRAELSTDPNTPNNISLLLAPEDAPVNFALEEVYSADSNPDGANDDINTHRVAISGPNGKVFSDNTTIRQTHSDEDASQNAGKKFKSVESIVLLENVEAGTYKISLVADANPSLKTQSLTLETRANVFVPSPFLALLTVLMIVFGIILFIIGLLRGGGSGGKPRQGRPVVERRKPRFGRNGRK